VDADLTLRSAHITPTHRQLTLDARDGVRSWSLQLAPSERGLRVSDVRLFCSEDSDDEGSEEEEEEEEGARIRLGRGKWVR